MLINLISSSNYQSYNVIIAKALGLETAVYLNALIEINEKAIRKDKLVDEHFLIDRNYILERTTLNASRQIDIECDLLDAKIIHKNDDDCIKVNIDVLSGIMMGKEESIMNDLSFLKKGNRPKKSEVILKTVKNYISDTYPEEMKQAYCEWLDVIQNKFGFVSKQMIMEAQDLVDDEADHNLDKAIEIIHIASANGWKDMRYAIKKYKKNKTTKLKEVKQNKIDIGIESF